MSNSVQPHRQQPTRLHCPWDSPGKNTGVGCHFLLQCMKVKSESEVAQSCLTLSDPMDCSLTRLLHPWDFPGKSTGVGCHCKTTLAKNKRMSDHKPSFLTIFHGECFPEDHLIGTAEFFSALPFFISRWVQAMIHAVSQHVLAGVCFIQCIESESKVT